MGNNDEMRNRCSSQGQGQQQNQGSMNQSSASISSGDHGREQSGQSDSGVRDLHSVKNERYSSVFENNTTDWQDRSTGSMGSQMSGSMTSRAANGMQNDSQDSMKDEDDEKRNKYGQSPDDIRKSKEDEQMIRDGYGEDQESNTNPYLKSMYENSTEEQLSGNGESIQQMSGDKSSSDKQEGQEKKDMHGQERITQKGTDQSIGDPMDAAKNY